MRDSTRELLALAGLFFCHVSVSEGLTAKQVRGLPEEVRFAANIENNFMLGGYRHVLNWTSHTLGLSKQNIMTHCTKATSKEGKVCAEVPMPTPWSSHVNLESPLPDYPRPQLRREQWVSLNGIWSFKSRGVQEVGDDWGSKESRNIVVPFPVEAPLSGVANHDVNNMEMLYTKSFSLPSEWNTESTRVLLHFDAVDHAATVTLNGHSLGGHAGGYERFSFDVTDYLVDGTNKLVVNAFDPTEFSHIPIGKQRLHPGRHPSSIFYTSSSGIWQTVWLEPVPEAYITRTELTPDIDNEQLLVKVHGSKAADGLAVSAVVTSQGKHVTAAEGKVGKEFKIKVSNPKLWSPDSPHLYDLDLTLESSNQESLPDLTTQAAAAASEGKGQAQVRVGRDGRKLQAWGGIFDKVLGASTKEEAEIGHTLRVPSAGPGDSVAAYFAMRKSSMGKTADGGLRPLLNNEFVFHTGMLDQGFWPDGLYTPATDDALIYDLKLTKELGFNMLRKHTKVESDRWYYHADRLGVLVWQDIPSMFYQAGAQDLSQKDKAQYKQELTNIMAQHYNFPCIVVWVIFNEGWGQHDTVEVAKYAQSLDSTRVLDAASGWTDFPVGDLVDMHNYVGPGSPLPTETRGAVLGEYGGLGRRMDGHMWIPDDAFAYEMHLTASSLQDRFKGLTIGLANLMVDKRFHLSAAVYTEVSDVEAEINGWVTYDRQVKKVNTAVLAAANKLLIDKSKAVGKGQILTPNQTTNHGLTTSVQLGKPAIRIAEHHLSGNSV